MRTTMIAMSAAIVLGAATMAPALAAHHGGGGGGGGGGRGAAAMGMGAGPMMRGGPGAAAMGVRPSLVPGQRHIWVQGGLGAYPYHHRRPYRYYGFWAPGWPYYYDYYYDYYDCYVLTPSGWVWVCD